MGTKADLKMLVKLTTDLNFINILGARFLHESVSNSFSLVWFWLWRKDFGEKSTFVQKNALVKC